MTMLDRMRRHKGWLKWSLAIVVLAFILLYIPSFLGNRSDTLSSDVVATVEGSEITAGDFRRTYQSQLQAYRGAYGANLSEQMLKQLGIDQQILAQMVDERAMIAEARRRGITVTDDEVRQRILGLPAFQENGQFNEVLYSRVLQMQRPPLTTDEFEDQVRRTLLTDKLRSAITGWVTVSDADVQAEYARRNEKVKLEVVPILVDKFRNQVQVTDAEVASYFEAHKAEYKVGEKRKVRYVLVDVDAMRPRVSVSQREVERFYNDNIETYSTPEEVRASHILLKTGEGKDDAAVKAKAEEILKEAQAPGADFAALAKKYSEDEASAKNGGDVDYFSRGRMVPEFEQAAFSMQPGEIQLVKSQYGYHIIKLVDKKPATTKSLDEVKAQITDQLAWDRARAKATEVADAMEKQIKKPADLDRVAAQNGLKVQESGYVTREEPIMAIGATPEVSAEIFGLQDGQVSGALQTQRGYAFVTLAGKEAPHVPTLAEAGVREKVRDNVIRQKASELAQQKAAQVIAEAKGGDLQKAAKAAGLEAKTTEMIAREQPIPDIGVSPQVDAVAFSLPVGGVSQPIKTDNALVVVRVADKKEPTPAEYAAAREKTREDLLTERRNRFFSAYMVKAKQAMKIEWNREAIQRVIGS